MNDIWARVDEAIDTDPLRLRDIVAEVLAHADKAEERLAAARTRMHDLAEDITAADKRKAQVAALQRELAEATRLRDNYKVAWETVKRDRQNIADQLFASCVCDPNPETTEGPLRDCPVHGTDEHRPLALLKRVEHAEATIERSRTALAAFAGRGQLGILVHNWDVPTPAEVLDAWRASLDAPTDVPAGAEVHDGAGEAQEGPR